jgi:hypothetical protein
MKQEDPVKGELQDTDEQEQDKKFLRGLLLFAACATFTTSLFALVAGLSTLAAEQKFTPVLYAVAFLILQTASFILRRMRRRMI